MSSLYTEEEPLLISNYGIPMAVRDNRRPREKQLAVYIILISTLLERIAFYTLASNLAVALDPIKAFANNSITPFIFFGTSYISTIIFAILSDWRYGRAKTIIAGFCIYLMGYISAVIMTSESNRHCIQLVSSGVCPDDSSSGCHGCYAWILLTLISIAIGAGAVESNMTVLGAEQIQDSKITLRYFDKYMVAVNVGGIIATGASLLSANPTDNQKKDYHIPCIIATSVLFVAAVLFIAGYRYYIHVRAEETVITKCIPVTINAFQSWYQYKETKPSKDDEYTNFSPSDILNASQSLTEDEKSRITDHRPATFLDFAKVPIGKFHDRIVDDVKSLRGVIIVFGLLIPYWLIYNQLSSTFLIQAQYMNGTNAHKIIYMWLSDPVTIIIGLLIINLFIYKFLDTEHSSFTITAKFVIGMCFACVTMCIAGSVEYFRQQGCVHDHIPGNNQSTLSILYLLPQNIFMGCSEIFAMLASFEYAYFAAPRSAQTLFMSLRFCSLGLSSFIATGYLAIFSTANSRMNFSCLPEGHEQWPFSTYFFVLAGLQFIFTIIFIVCQKKYTIIKLNPQHTETNQFLRHSFSSRR